MTVPNIGEPPVVMFVAEKEEESKMTLAEHCRTHDLTIIETDGLYKAHEKVRIIETIGRRKLTQRPELTIVNIGTAFERLMSVNLSAGPNLEAD